MRQSAAWPLPERVLRSDFWKSERSELVHQLGQNNAKELRVEHRNEVATISAFRTYTPNGKAVITYEPDADLNNSDSYLIPFSAGKNDCHFINCALTYADQLSGKYEYSPPYRNSSTLLGWVVKSCGGSVNFPNLAIGGDDSQ